MGCTNSTQFVVVNSSRLAPGSAADREKGVAGRLLLGAAYGTAPASAVVARTDQVRSTTLRKVASRSRGAGVWVDDRTSVKNGERVAVLRADAGGFSMVQASNGTSGYIQSEYLQPLVPQAGGGKPSNLAGAKYAAKEKGSWGRGTYVKIKYKIK